jgi:hypothetical protein
MPYSTKDIEHILRIVANRLDISDSLFKKAESEYRAFSEWVKQKTDYDVSMYSQGSFALGTVIKPIDDADDYDLDLVCELAEDYGLTAKQLKKEIVYGWLKQYKEVKGIEEKRKCWHVEYKHVDNFHMDVIPGYKKGEGKDTSINITYHEDESDYYIYEGSDPKGYTDWFKGRCKLRYQALLENYMLVHSGERRFNEEVKVEEIPRSELNTPLQMSIQLLKRHRDIMFADYPDEDVATGNEISKADKPISILITTITAELYNNQGSICETIQNFIDNAEQYLEEHKHNGIYLVENPSYRGDFFTDKWKDNPLRKKAFFEWLNRVKQDLSIQKWSKYNTIDMGRQIKRIFGEKFGDRVITEMANNEKDAIISGNYKMNPNTGVLSEEGSIDVIPNHHHG